VSGSVDDASFSVQVKGELAHLLPPLACCRRTELAALFRACGRVELAGAGRLSVALTTDHATVARKIITLLKTSYGVKPVVMVMRRRRLRKNLSYLIRVSPQPGLTEMLKAMGVIDLDGNLLDWGDLTALDADHCRKAYLRGTFLGTGWVSPPDGKHHLEMTTTATEAADALGQLLFGFGISVRMAYRKDTMVLYVKDTANIARFLSVVGAHQSLLQFEDVRVLKDMKNRVNRQVNAETANLSKTVEAASRQIETLEHFRAGGGLERLSPALLELAVLRVNHPEASLAELGELCVPKVSKSAANHRMRLLMQLAGE